LRLIGGAWKFDDSPSKPARLLQARRQHGWSTGAAARYLGVDRTTRQDWERGELILFREHRLKVAKLLRLDSQVLANEMRTRRNGKHWRWKCREP